MVWNIIARSCVFEGRASVFYYYFSQLKLRASDMYIVYLGKI